MRLVIGMMLVLMSFSSAWCASNRHEMKAFGLTIESNKYRNGRKIEYVETKKRDYIKGRNSSYRRDGIPLDRHQSPYVEFPIETKLPGGSFFVTVVYRISGDFAELRKQGIYLEMDDMGAQFYEFKRARGLVLRHTSEIKVNAWKGNKHSVKIWLPTEGVEIDKIEIRRNMNTNKS